jgi:hypothetical protein
MVRGLLPPLRLQQQRPLWENSIMALAPQCPSLSTLPTRIVLTSGRDEALTQAEVAEIARRLVRATTEAERHHLLAIALTHAARRAGAGLTEPIGTTLGGTLKGLRAHEAAAPGAYAEALRLVRLTGEAAREAVLHPAATPRGTAATALATAASRHAAHLLPALATRREARAGHWTRANGMIVIHLVAAPPRGLEFEDSEYDPEMEYFLGGLIHSVAEPEGETALEYDTPPMTGVISDAVDKKNWPRVLELAMQVGWHDENQLTNLLFFSRHKELDRRKLEPRKNIVDQKLVQEWSQILVKEVRPAIQKAAEDSNLEVSGHFVAERDPQLSGEKGGKFKEVVAWAAKEVDMDPGFLAAVLLAEVDSASPYLSPGEVRSFFTGTDDFFEQRAQLRANVPAFSQVHFDERRKTTNINEHGRQVTTIPYKTGRDAALATAVYLKYGEIKLRRAAQRNGGNFDTLPVATRFVLTRIAMAAGHGGISPEGDLIRFKKKGGQFVRAKPGETGGILFGVAHSLDRVLKGEDILIRNWEPRKDPTNDSHITHRNATILASQAMHLGGWFFHAQPLGIQPELEESEGKARQPFFIRNIPTKGWYKGIENNPWGGLPQVLYPDTPDDFQSLTVIEIDVDQMARIRFDAQTIQSKSFGERRLPHNPDWASFFVQERASGPGVPTLAELAAEHQRLRDQVLSEIASMKKRELREFLSQRIHVVLPAFSGVRSLRRTESLAPPQYLHEERLIRFLLQHPPRS